MNQYKLLKVLTDKTNEEFADVMTDITDEHFNALKIGKIMNSEYLMSETHLTLIQRSLNDGSAPELAGHLREAHEFISKLFSYIDATAIAVDQSIVKSIVESEFDEFDDLFDDEPAPPVVSEPVPPVVTDNKPDEDEFSDIFGEKEAIVMKEAGDPFDRSSVSSNIDEAGPWDQIGDLPPPVEGDTGIGGTFELGGEDDDF